MSHSQDYLAPTAQQPLNKYIPQSPKPHSPPQTPSPVSPGKPILSLPPHTTDSQDERGMSTGTPEGYSYSSSPSLPIVAEASSHKPSSSSPLAGMGISFPPEANPLPTELYTQEQPSSSDHLPVMNGPPSLQRRRSSEGVNFPLSNGGGVAMSQSLSTGSTSSVTNAPSQSLSPYPPSIIGQLNTPPRPRTISPRHNAPTTFASSSSLGKSGLGEPRERVLSPSKVDMAGGISDQEYGSGTGNHLDPNNPYDQPPILKEKQNWTSANSAFSSFGGVGSQPYFPLTGKENLLGNSPTVHPTKVPFKDSVGYWLALYFCFNLGLTLFNKFVLVSFPFPYTLTGLHALSGCAGTYIALEQGAFTPARLTQKENIILAAFSVLYTINIAVSNISLQLVSIPFHQVVRASTPLFTILITAIFLRARFSALKLISLLPVVAGVGFATYGDYDFTALGLILTLLGTFLAALKTVVTNLIQTGAGGRLKLHPLDLLMRMSPLAFIQCVVYGWYTGELERVRRYGATQMTRSKAIALLFNGVFAFGLNIVSFTANKKAGALTMTVSANCKQVLTIVLAVMLFNLHISPTNGVGILLTLLGGGWYGYVEYIEKKKKTKVLERA
ncbi:uncharacterized protein IL334_001367 [Kwoniella shivajii]|uniref:Sugar phosphate transporter domain-containing protein n=1 Tax=Kwoniella shivajii TaxID=564305 RepID=A0ABZ1CRS2_9TREE|nr:hypothetical protein IL334_001367 [Kwoniella shivajii]